MMDNVLQNELVDLLADNINVRESCRALEKQFRSKGKVQASTVHKFVYDLLLESHAFRFLNGAPYELCMQEGRYKACHLYDVYNYIRVAFDCIADNLRHFISSSRLSQAVEPVRYAPAVALDSRFNKVVNMINCQNGIVEIRHDGIYFYKKSIEMIEMLQSNYCVAAQYIDVSSKTENERLKMTPVFNMFCQTSFGAEWLEKRKQLMEVIGYSLSDFPAVKKAFFLIGQPDSGKSVTLDFLSKMLGPDAVKEHLISAVELHDFGEKFRFSQVCRAKININGELSSNPIQSISNFKLAIGGDVVNVEDKGKDPTAVSTRVKLVFAGNHLPQVTDLDPTRAYFNRIQLIEFPNSIPKEKQIFDLREQIWEERDAIFSEAMLALVDLLNRRFVFHTLPSDRIFLDKWYKNANSFVRFFHECLYEDVDSGGTSSKELQEEYKAYCRRNAYEIMAWSHCHAILKEQGYTTSRGRYNGDSVHGYKTLKYTQSVFCKNLSKKKFDEVYGATGNYQLALEEEANLYFDCLKDESPYRD